MKECKADKLFYEFGLGEKISRFNFFSMISKKTGVKEQGKMFSKMRE